MNFYEERLFAAATKKGDELGYKLVAEQLPLLKEEAVQHQKSLFYRNIDGLLLLPQWLPLDLSDLYSWDRFSVVCAGFSPISPDFDRVAANWFHATRLCIATLGGRGCRRIGLVCGAHFDFMTNHLPTSAAAGAALVGRLEYVSPFIYLPQIGEPFVSRLTPSFRAVVRDWRLAPYKNQLHSFPGEFVEWFDREKPDALVSDTEETMNVIASILGHRLCDSVGRACVSVSGSPSIEGVDQEPDMIGEAAVELMHKKIAHGVRGVPRSSSIQLFKGRWRTPGSLVLPP